MQHFVSWMWILSSTAHFNVFCVQGSITHCSTLLSLWDILVVFDINVIFWSTDSLVIMMKWLGCMAVNNVLSCCVWLQFGLLIMSIIKIIMCTSTGQTWSWSLCTEEETCVLVVPVQLPNAPVSVSAVWLSGCNQAVCLVILIQGLWTSIFRIEEAFQRFRVFIKP